MEELKTLIKQFEKNYKPDDIQVAKELHQEYITKFPREKFETLALEEYALGISKTGSLCWWLEYHTRSLGSIKGGNASKLIIYYSKKEGEWKFPSKFSSVEIAWNKLRADIVELIDAYNVLPSTGVSDDNLLNNANMLKGKLLYLYHPEKLLPIYKVEHLQQFLKILGVSEKGCQGKDNIDCNLLLKDAVNTHQIFKNWHPVKITNFLYNTFMKDEKYYKIAPGEGAIYWDECKNGNYISIGWNEIGDLKQYPDYDEFKAAFQKYNFHSTASKNTEKANELWMFYNLKPGDKVLANKGKSQILGVGSVTDGYHFREDLNTQRHVVYVDWNIFDPPLNIPKQDYWPMKTIVEVTQKEYLEWTNKEKSGLINYTVEEERIFERLETALERKGQCILYGPPGTGKTYLARKFVQWKNDKENLLQLTGSQNIKTWMMIASAKHNFQWESILSHEGIIQFSLKSVQSNFKAAKKGDRVICYKGATSERGYVGIAEINEPFDGEHLIVKGIRPFKEPIPFDEVKETSAYRTSQAGRMNNRGTMFEVNEELIKFIKEQLLENDDQEAAKLIDVSERNNMEMVTFHPSFNYEDFIEGYKPIPNESGQVVFELYKGTFRNLCFKAQENPDIPYYLVIDEINRGNVPKIFGELITLLEKDKRGLEVKLPQSKDSFAIPENIYIIGTMNTSDRSIKIMDAALKRRFAFMECMPKLNLIANEIDNLGMSPAVIIQKINQELTRLMGRDKQIGHAYFMKNGGQITSVEELKEIYELDIIPLVQEYCFDDYSQLAQIIGAVFVKEENMEINQEIFRETDDVFISEIVKIFKG